MEGMENTLTGIRLDQNVQSRKTKIQEQDQRVQKYNSQKKQGLARQTTGAASSSAGCHAPHPVAQHTFSSYASQPSLTPRSHRQRAHEPRRARRASACVSPAAC